MKIKDHVKTVDTKEYRLIGAPFQGEVVAIREADTVTVKLPSGELEVIGKGWIKIVK